MHITAGVEVSTVAVALMREALPGLPPAPLLLPIRAGSRQCTADCSCKGLPVCNMIAGAVCSSRQAVNPMMMLTINIRAEFQHANCAQRSVEQLMGIDTEETAMVEVQSDAPLYEEANVRQ